MRTGVMIGKAGLWLAVGLNVVWGAAARASTFSIVYQGKVATSGVLAADTAANLYVEEQSRSGNGSVVALAVTSGYGTANVLYKLAGYPEGGVILTPHNDILGTGCNGGRYGDGLVFDLGKPNSIQFTALHVFNYTGTKPFDGAAPCAGLTAGLSGKYFGTTEGGGKYAKGALFSIAASTTEPRYRLLHSFGGHGDGAYPWLGRLAVDAQGRLYGTTTYGGKAGQGTVFMMQYVNGGWLEQVIYNFIDNATLRKPRGNVVVDSAGNIYGCAPGGHAEGGIYQLSPPAQGQTAWTETVLYIFGTKRDDPVATDQCNLAIDPATNLIVGTSSFGGNKNLGTIFTLAPPQQNQTAWTETVGYSFQGDSDGVGPATAPLKVGATYYGGNPNTGAIYAFTP